MPRLDDLLVESSRTFAVGIGLLPEPLRQEITVAYLLLRVSDHIEDTTTLEDREKITLLRLWARTLADLDPSDRGTFANTEIAGHLREAGGGTPDSLVARDTSAVLGGLAALEPVAREIVARRVCESTLGMARWVERGSDFGDEDDLDDYMHQVAGRVGLLLTELFAVRLSGVARGVSRMMTLGREFGLGLQTVNVIRGLNEDPDRGWVFVPRSFVPDGADPGTIFHGSGEAPSPAAMAVLDRLATKAEGHLDAAIAYTKLIPRRHHGARLFCVLPLLFAVRTLALSKANPDVLRQEVKMTRREVLSITRGAKLLGFSNRWLDWRRRRLATGA